MDGRPKSFPIKEDSFENKLFKELCSLAQVQKIRTSPYHPETNGSCE